MLLAMVTFVVMVGDVMPSVLVVHMYKEDDADGRQAKSSFVAVHNKSVPYDTNG
jgi:hypothetical protein